MDALAMPVEIPELQELIQSLRQSLQCEQAGKEALRAENQLLRQKLALFIKRYFGNKKNEGIDPAQLELLLAGLEALQVKPAPESKPTRVSGASRPKAVRQPLPEHLLTEEIVLEPAEVAQAPEAWRKIDQEVTEELDWKPAQFIRRRYIRPKYVRREAAPKAENVVGEALAAIYGQDTPAVVMAPLPSRLIDKGLPGAGLLAQVVISKYEDHLPLYRQAKIYWERHGVKISRASLAEWVESVAQWLKPIYVLIRKGLIEGKYLQADETPIRYLDPDVPGKSQMGFLWAYSRPGAEVIFEWRTDRSRAGPEKFLEKFTGLLQTDGYAVYDSLAAERPKDLTLLGCMAHVRRRFHQALEDDRRAGWFLRQFGHLYALEKRLRQRGAGPALRQAQRLAEARPVLERIQRAMRLLETKVLPRSLLGIAIRHALDRWTVVCRYVDHGQAEIDSNLVENAIRPTALGKKNFLFVGHPDAGWRSAVIYSVLGSCRRLGIDPHQYLQDVLRRLPDMKITEVEQLTPAAWAKAKRSIRAKAA